MIDIGCGSGRWTDYFVDKAGFIEAIDSSDAILVADKMLGAKDNVRITKASVDTIPWNDETFDFGMSIGVLHHIPDTKQALINCVKKIKKGGHFYIYLYYRFDNRGFLFIQWFTSYNFKNAICFKEIYLRFTSYNNLLAAIQVCRLAA